MDRYSSYVSSISISKLEMKASAYLDITEMFLILIILCAVIDKK